MSGSPERLLQRYFEAFNRHAEDELLALLADDIQALYPAEPHRNWRGKEAAQGVFRGYFAAYPDFRVELRIEKTEPEPDGEAVAVYLRNRLVATGLDRHVHMKYIVADGRIRAVHHLA